tara:strand:+ start:871 stop:1446 length:576 start_codon:yes stop_codon:yes gene_type:complete
MKKTFLATHQLPMIKTIYKGFLSEKYCDDIVTAYKNTDKIDNTGLNQDNLFDTERTNWLAHNDPTVKNVAGEIFRMFGDSVTFDSFECTKANVNLIESWIAESQENAFVEPHHHGLNFYGCCWSFVFYAKIPKEKSSLVFLDKMHGKHEILVRQGDFLVFPSDCVHYTEDTCVGRTIYSGNFEVALIRGNL